MKLYAMPGTCALAPNIAAKWLGLDVEIVNIERGKHKEAGFLAINPNGQVPALEVSPGVVLAEASAILFYLARSASSNALDPADVLAWARVAEALSFMTTEVHAHYAGHFGTQRFADTEDARSQVRTKTYEKLRADYARLEQVLSHSGGEWYLGYRSIADTYLYVLTRWVVLTPLSLADYPSLKGFKEMMEADPLVIRALESQGMLQG